MSPAKALIAIGLFLVVIGIVWLGLERVLPLGRLPGDLRFERGPVRVYLPFATMIVISIVLTIVLNLIARWKR